MTKSELESLESEVKRLKESSIRCELIGDYGLADMYWLDHLKALSKLKAIESETGQALLSEAIRQAKLYGKY